MCVCGAGAFVIFSCARDLVSDRPWNLKFGHHESTFVNVPIPWPSVAKLMLNVMACVVHLTCEGLRFAPAHRSPRPSDGIDVYLDIS